MARFKLSESHVEVPYVFETDDALEAVEYFLVCVREGNKVTLKAKASDVRPA